MWYNLVMTNITPLQGELITLDEQAQQSIIDLRNEPVVYSVSSPANQSLMLKRTPAAKRTYLSRLNESARLWGFTLNIPGSLPHREKQARQRELYKQVPWDKVRRAHVVALLSLLRDVPIDHSTLKYRSAQTINVTLAAIKDVARQAFSLGQMTGDEFKHIELLKGDRVFRQPVGRNIPLGEIRALMSVCEVDETPAGCRDAAIIGLMYTGGLRRFEVATIDVENLNFEEKVIELVGKGRKPRKTWPDEGTWLALKDWLSCRGNFDGPLFQSVNKGGKIVPSGHISDQAVYNAVLKRVDQAALARKTSPHDYRRSFITTLLSNNVDVIKARDLAGHNSTDTTALYDLRPEQELKKAQEVLSLPYSGRKASYENS